MLQLVIVTALSILLCLITNIKSREKIWFLLSMLIITFFFAIRYDYGLDYVAYHDLFDRGASSTTYRGDQEQLFYSFMSIFPYFYQFVIVYTILIMGGVFLLAKKMCSAKYYALFIFSFMLIVGLAANLMSSMRSSLAALILWVGLYFFYILKKRWIIFSVIVLFASGFHLSVLSFLTLPIFDYLFCKIKPQTTFAIICFCYIFSFFGDLFLFEQIISVNNVFNSYANYYDFMDKNSRSVFGLLNNAIYLLPTYFICKNKNEFVKKRCSGIYIISIVYMIIFSLNLDFQGRFTSYIGLFFILAVCQLLEFSSPHIISNYGRKEIVFRNTTYIILPLVFKTLLDFYKYCLSLTSSFYTNIEGNPLLYRTIFDAPYFPF